MLKACLIGCTLTLVAAGSAQAQDAANGEKIFKRCQACHVADGKTNKIGPHLGDVIGRTAGTAEGFTKYSPAMKAKGEEGLVWDAQTISEYLADPKGYIPKNKMAYPGLKKPDERADVIAYLEQVSAK